MFHNKKNHLFDLIDHFLVKRIGVCSIYERPLDQINFSNPLSRTLFLLELLLLLWSSLWVLPVQAVTDCAVQTEIPTVECEALLALYQSTTGANWSNQNGWSVDNEPCKWVGITCTEGTEKHVKTISLMENNLSGILPGELNNLSQLEYLFLPNNQLHDVLPEWKNMTALQELNLSANQFSGILPEWKSMTALRVLYLSNNQLSGVLPEWKSMTALQSLRLDNNKLNGSIPPEWGNLALQEVFLYQNQLSGSLPPKWGNMSALRSLDLNSNHLTGSLPPEWDNLKNLTRLSLLDNQLSGPLPAQWNTMDNLEEIHLNRNHLSGNIPKEWSHFNALHSLILHHNQLSSEIPPEFASLSLQKFEVNYNMLTAVSNDIVEWVNHRDPNWQASQTVPPNHFRLTPLPADQVRLNWNPILYQEDNGYYEIGYTTQARGPYNTIDRVPGDKSASTYLLSNIPPSTPYYFVIRTHTTNPDNDTKNSSTSLWSNEISTRVLVQKFSLHIELEGQGTVSGSGIQCGIDCDEDYEAGISVTLEAQAKPSFFFTGWNGACHTLPNPATFTMEQPKTCTAKFEKMFPLTLTPTPQNGLIESGTLEGDLFKPDGRLQCGHDHALCTKNDYLIHTLVLLQARATPGYLFSGWEGDCQNLSNPAPLTMEQARTCSATFNPASLMIKLSIKIERNPGGEGYVIGSLIDDQNKFIGSPIIDCGKDCDEDFSQVKRVSLTVVPSSTSILSKWECNGQAQSRRQPIFTLQQNLTCIARFEKDISPSRVTLSKIGQGRLSAKRQGEVFPELTCSVAGACQASKTFSLGKMVVVTAIPDPGFVTHWVSGNCLSDPKNLNNPNRVIFPANDSKERFCHAEFVRDENDATQELSVQVVGKGMITGNIRGSVLGQFYCQEPELCKNYYQPDMNMDVTSTDVKPIPTEVSLTAVPSFSSVFKGWQGCSTVSSPSIFVPLPSSGCTATFIDRHEQIVERFCRKMGEGGAYLKQGTKKISVYNTVWCSPINRTRLQEAFRLAYPAKMMMDLQQGVINSWPDHFASKVTSWYRQYPDGIKNIRTLTAGNVELQVRLKDQNDQEQTVTISHGKEPTGEEGTFLFKRTEEQFQKLYDLAGELRRDFFQKLNNDVEVMRLYGESENQIRLQNALWLALPALLTAEENLRLGSNWPESFDGISWYDPQPPWSVSQARVNHTRGVRSVKLMAGEVIDLQLTLINDNHQDKEVSVLIYYGEPPQGGILYPR